MIKIECFETFFLRYKIPKIISTMSYRRTQRKETVKKPFCKVCKDAGKSEKSTLAILFDRLSSRKSNYLSNNLEHKMYFVTELDI